MRPLEEVWPIRCQGLPPMAARVDPFPPSAVPRQLFFAHLTVKAGGSVHLSAVPTALYLPVHVKPSWLKSIPEPLRAISPMRSLRPSSFAFRYYSPLPCGYHRLKNFQARCSRRFECSFLQRKPCRIILRSEFPATFARTSNSCCCGGFPETRQWLLAPARGPHPIGQNAHHPLYRCGRKKSVIL